MRIKIAPFGVDGWGRVVFMTASGAVWKTITLYDPDTPFLWEDLHELCSSDSFDGEPGFPRPIGDFELVASSNMGGRWR